MKQIESIVRLSQLSQNKKKESSKSSLQNTSPSLPPVDQENKTTDQPNPLSEFNVLNKSTHEELFSCEIDDIKRDTKKDYSFDVDFTRETRLLRMSDYDKMMFLESLNRIDEQDQWPVVSKPKRSLLVSFVSY